MYVDQWCPYDERVLSRRPEDVLAPLVDIGFRVRVSTSPSPVSCNVCVSIHLLVFPSTPRLILFDATAFLSPTYEISGIIELDRPTFPPRYSTSFHGLDVQGCPSSTPLWLHNRSARSCLLCLQVMNICPFPVNLYVSTGHRVGSYWGNHTTVSCHLIFIDGDSLMAGARLCLPKCFSERLFRTIVDRPCPLPHPISR